jgi:hypothetical protein
MKAPRKNRRIRPSYQRDFVHWFRENQGRFTLPISLLKRTKISIEITLPGLSPLISFSLAPNALMVWLHKDGEYFDILADFDIAPTRRGRGFINCLCLAEDQVVYPNLASLRRAEVYEPFLKWVNKKLANARWINLYRSTGFWGGDLVWSDSEKSQPTPGMLLGVELVSLSREIIYDPRRDEMMTWLYPVFPENIETDSMKSDSATSAPD